MNSEKNIKSDATDIHDELTSTKEHEMNINDTATATTATTTTNKEHNMADVEKALSDLRVLSAIDPEKSRKGIEFNPIMIGVESDEYHDMDEAIDFCRKIHPERVGHIKLTESGKVKVFWAPKDTPWDDIPKICKVASRPGRVAKYPQKVEATVAKHSDGVWLSAPTGVVRRFNIEHGMKNIDGPCQVSSFDVIGKGTIVPGDVDKVTISDDCGLPIGTEVKVDLGRISSFQLNFKGRISIGPRMLINATVAATYGDPWYRSYAAFLHRKFDSWYRTISDTENGNIAKHSSGAIAELAYHRLPCPMGYIDRLGVAVECATLGRRLGPKVQALSGYAIGMSPDYVGVSHGDLPYGVIISPDYHGVVTVATHRFPGIHHKTFALPALVVGKASRSAVRRGLRRVGIAASSSVVNEICRIAHSPASNAMFMNEEFLHQLQGDSDGDGVFCVPFNHRVNVQNYRPGITEKLESLVTGRVGESNSVQDRIDNLKTAALNAIGIVDYQTFNAIAYYASNWRDIDRKIRKAHIDRIFYEYAIEYQVSIFGNKKTTSYVSHANEIHKKFQASRGMEYHPDSVINRVLKAKDIDSIPELITSLYEHQSGCRTNCMVTNKWINAYLGVMESRVSLVRDNSWAEAWDRFVDPDIENEKTKFVIDVVKEAYHDDSIDWDVMVRWAAGVLSEDGATLADIARLVLPDRKNVIARNITMALSIARILGIDLTPVRKVLRRKPRVVDVELFGNMDYQPDYLDSVVVDDGDDNLGYDDDEMTEF